MVKIHLCRTKENFSKYAKQKTKQTNITLKLQIQNESYLYYILKNSAPLYNLRGSMC